MMEGVYVESDALTFKNRVMQHVALKVDTGDHKFFINYLQIYKI